MCFTDKKSHAIAHLTKLQSCNTQKQDDNLKQRIDEKVSQIQMLRENVNNLNQRLLSGDNCEPISLEDLNEHDNAMISDESDSDDDRAYLVDKGFSGQHQYYVDVRMKHSIKNCLKN